MSETPETDGITFFATKDMMPPYNTVPAEFARKLERERNEARNIARWLYQHGMATLKEGAYRRPWVKEAIQ